MSSASGFIASIALVTGLKSSYSTSISETASSAISFVVAATTATASPMNLTLSTAMKCLSSR